MALLCTRLGGKQRPRCRSSEAPGLFEAAVENCFKTARFARAAGGCCNTSAPSSRRRQSRRTITHHTAHSTQRTAHDTQHTQKPTATHYLGVVGERERLVVVGEAEERDGGAEGLLPEHAPLFFCIVFLCLLVVCWLFVCYLFVGCLLFVCWLFCCVV